MKETNELNATAPASRVVVATGAASSSNVPGLAERIEEAMAQAVKDSFADGVTEPDKVRARMLEARERVKAEAKISPPAPIEPGDQNDWISAATGAVEAIESRDAMMRRFSSQED